jgi:mannose-6-phosphate isomerase
MTRRSDWFYPLRFSPALKDYIWGGRNLERLLGRRLPEGRVAESWEIAAHEDGESRVANGPLAGMTLTNVHKLLGIDLIGRRNTWAEEREKFPLLVKLLDAQDKLSVQVHPGDAYALAHEGNELGKTEMWVVLRAEPGAQISLGMRHGATKDVVREAIANGTLEQFLHYIDVKAGDFVCVPSGTLHTILGGVLIAEIQQNSNTTYRVYDWNRTKDGVARPLHVDKALETIDFTVIEPALPSAKLLSEMDGVQRWLLCHNPYFTTERLVFGPGAKFVGDLVGDTLEIWGAIEGRIEINDVELEATEFALLPASTGDYQVVATNRATCLRTYTGPYS